MNLSCIQGKIFKANKSLLQCFFKSGKYGIKQTQKYSNFLHTYFCAGHARGVADRHAVTSTAHIFNGAIIYWCSKKQTETSWISSNTETIAMYTEVVDKNWIIIFCCSDGYPIVSSSKLYEYNQATIKQVLADSC